MSSFSSYPTDVTSCLVMADRLANALEMLIKRWGFKKAADILEQGCSNKHEQKLSKLCLATLPAISFFMVYYHDNYRIMIQSS